MPASPASRRIPERAGPAMPRVSRSRFPQPGRPRKDVVTAEAWKKVGSRKSEVGRDEEFSQDRMSVQRVTFGRRRPVPVVLITMEFYSSLDPRQVLDRRSHNHE